MISVGIDVHKKRCQACLKDEKGRLIEELSFPRDQEGINDFRMLLQNHGEAKIVLESTGNLWIPIYDSLAEYPTNKVILANPRKTRIIAEAKIKNDKMDARVLADLVRADFSRKLCTRRTHPSATSITKAAKKPRRRYRNYQESYPQPS